MKYLPTNLAFHNFYPSSSQRKMQHSSPDVRPYVFHCCPMHEWNSVTHFPLGGIAIISKVSFSNSCYQGNATQSQVNIGSGNGLVPSGNKPLPEPNLAILYCNFIWPQCVNNYLYECGTLIQNIRENSLQIRFSKYMPCHRMSTECLYISNSLNSILFGVLIFAWPPWVETYMWKPYKNYNILTMEPTGPED